MRRNQIWEQNNPGIIGIGEADDFFGSSLAVGDFNRDGRDDLGIGVSGEDVGFLRDAGAANVLYGSSNGLTANGNQIWTQETFGVKGVEEEFDRFGSRLASADFNGDNRADLAIGVPGESVGNIQEAGAVNVLYSSSSGVDTPNDQIWEQNTPGVEGIAEGKDRFGGALGTGDFDGDGYDDLAVGVAGEDVGSISAAGAVNVLYGSDSGLTTIGNQIWEQDTPGVRGIAEELDLFGGTLASGDFNGDGLDDLSIGVVLESIRNINYAGAVNVLYGSENGLSVTGNQIWHQDTGAIQDVAEESDFFGTSQAAGDFNGDGFDDLAIGVSRDTFLGPTLGGSVNILYGSPSGLTITGNQIWSQSLSGIIGVEETGDMFGASLGVGDFNGDGVDDLAIGVPGEDIGNISDAGAVNIIYGSSGPGLNNTNNQIWHQNTSGVEGIAESGDRFGSSLGVGDLNGDGFDDLAIGVSGEDSGNISNSGAVNVLYGSANGLTAGIG